ncbi:TolC family protein [Pontibacter sp. G13]|uniref:TolC family protein n=1 Tax=Pontibacter sp. G13 TaxID=3074898 RepID=UPI002889ACE7|nr:TolC family protein [Pontibacter sp. G13]WNJ16448.1 TolC family protein [Pontibacter sp. G13]
MMRTLFILALGISALGGQRLSAQNLADYLAIGRDSFPGLQAIRQQLSAQSLSPDQVTGWKDPSVSVGVFPLPVETRLGPQQAKLSIRQQFPWFGQQQAGKEVAESKIGLATQAVNLETLEWSEQVKILWWEMIGNAELVAILNARLDWLHQLEEVATQRLETGNGSSIRVIEIQMEQSKLDKKLTDQRAHQVRLSQRFNLLLGRKLDAEIAYSDSLALPRETFWENDWRDSMYRSHPGVAWFDARIQQLEAERNLIDRQRKPQLSAGLDYLLIGNRTDADPLNNGRDALMLSGGLQIPVSGKQWRAKMEEKTLMARAQHLEQQALIDNLLGEALKSVETLNTLWRDWELNLSLDQQAQTLESLMLDAYTRDGAEFEDLLDLENDRLEYQLRAWNARILWHAQLAHLEKLLGS